jgi:hypothetical protein
MTYQELRASENSDSQNSCPRLNGLGGLAFGWLYWKRGLESAMMAHFSADIVLHVITPLVATLVA